MITKKEMDAAIYRTSLACKDQICGVKAMYILYYNLFSEWPYNSWNISLKKIYEESRPWNDNPADHHFSDIDWDKFHNDIVELGYTRCEIDYDDVYINIFNKTVLLLKSNCVACVGNISEDNEELQKIKKILKPRNKKNDTIEVGILVERNGNYYVDETDIDIMKIDVKKTYNDDLPVKPIDDFIETEKNGLMLLYGEPGTGKTTYIRHLMQTHTNKKFIILDSHLLYNITSYSLLKTFIDEKNAIYVIEDCEKLLVSRENETNPIISAFLNMTDGILANVINCKFICTFNTELDNIDDALKRKGRLKLKYEFKKLASDKVDKILKTENNSDMTIADVIYSKHQNDYSSKKKNKIGF